MAHAVHLHAVPVDARQLRRDQIQQLRRRRRRPWHILLNGQQCVVLLLSHIDLTTYSQTPDHWDHYTTSQVQQCNSKRSFISQVYSPDYN